MLDQFQIYEQVILETLGPATQLKSANLISAGNHNQGIRLETSAGIFFLKLNFDHERNILEKESEGGRKNSGYH